MKKKVLFVNGHVNVGGVERSLINVLQNINYSIYVVDLILFEGLGDYLNEIPKEVNIIFFDLTKMYGPFVKCMKDSIKNKDFTAFMYRLIILLEKFFGIKVFALAKPLFKRMKQYDCAIAYRIGICTEFVSFIVKANKKITWWHHGEYDYSEQMTKRWNKALTKIDKIVIVSEGCKSILLEHFDNITYRLVTIPNMVNYQDILEKSRKNINLNDSINLLSIGRLSSEKNMIACIETCKILVDNGHKLKWYIIGDGNQKEKIKNKIKEYKLENNVILLGRLSNPYPYIKSAEIFVHPSNVESLGIAILEALALGTPSVVANSMGAMQFVKNGENAVLVEPTAIGLYQGIKRLMEDKELYIKLNRPQVVTLKPYTPQIIMDKIYDLIER